MTTRSNEDSAAAAQKVQEEEMDRLIGRVLQIGVLLAALVVAVAAAALLWSQGGRTADFRTFTGGRSSLSSFGGILRGMMAGDAQAIVQLGLVLLIATPVARVALTLGAFVYQKDRLYIGITTLVLGLLLYGLLWGGG